jgi:hypothetical protein
MTLAALTSNPGRITVWGAATNPLVVSGPPDGEFVALAAGGNEQTLAIGSNGRLSLNAVAGAAPGVPPALTNLEFCGVGLGRNHGLAIDRDGRVRIWPSAAAADGAPASGRFAAVAGAGGFFSVALDMDAQVVTWGGRGDSAAGVPAVPARDLTRMSVAPPTGRFTAIASRGRYVLALAEDGYIYGWGTSNAGTGTDFPIFTGTSTTAPWTPSGLTPDGRPQHYIAPIDPSISYTAIAAGLDVILGLRADGTLVQWAVDPTDGAIPMPSPPSGVRFSQIAAGGLDENGQVHAWGRQPWINTISSGSSGVYSALQASTTHIAAIEAPSEFLWPPNHQMRTIALTFRADDNCEPVPLSNLSLVLSSSPAFTGVEPGQKCGETNGGWGPL